MAKKEDKTNVMRILEQHGIPYTPHAYEHDGAPVGGVVAAQRLGLPHEQVFKTLVARGASRQVYVFDIPVAEELDLKKAARAVGEKSIEMTAVKELPGLTGYVRGGCSPIGMKKSYPTVFHKSVEALETVVLSAGKLGRQVELAPAALLALVGGSTADLVVSHEE